MIIRNQFAKTSACVRALALILVCATSPLESNGGQKAYHSSIPMTSEESRVGDDLCISFGAAMVADLFEGLQRIETKTGDVFVRANHPIKNFPDTVQVQLWAKPYVCGSARTASQKSKTILDTAIIEAFWKRDVELRPASIISCVKKHFSGANLWLFVVEIRGLNVPLDDHLVVSIQRVEGERLARLSGSL
jgi:hypothetical protein